jgi:peptide/nickel transport system substrate-binding protein
MNQKTMRGLSVWRAPAFRYGKLLPLLACCLLLLSCRRPGSDPSTLVFLLESSPVSLDPRIGTDAFSERLHGLLFNSLVRRDMHADLVPDLALSWENPDPLTYSFHLRRGVRFHDGRPLTAADVKYTFESILSGAVNTVKRRQYQNISQIETPSVDLVIFRLKESNAGFLWLLSLGEIGIVPEGAGADCARQPIGTGPFKFVGMREDDHVVLSRNPDYFGGPPRLERIEFKIVPEAIVRALELRNGSADLALNELTPDVVHALQSDKKLRIIENPGTTYKYLAFNLQDPILKNLKVRQAIAYALDVPAMIRYLWRGQGDPASGILPPDCWAYEPEVRKYPRDLLLARKLLDEAGYPDPDGSGTLPRFTLTYKTSTEELSRLEAMVIQQQLREVGIGVEIRSFEFATFYADIARGDFQMYSLRWIGDNLNPDILDTVFNSRNVPPGGKNRGHYLNSRVDELIQRSRTELDRNTRKEYYSEIQKLVAEDLPYLSLWYVHNVCVANRRVKDVHLVPSGDFDFLKDVTVDDH